jgi:isoquinoline 1-oxidoreductase alpha subunit
MISFTLNGRSVSLDVEPEMPLLWALRENAGLLGTKFGCGIGVCGACTVHMDGDPVRSCMIMMEAVSGREVTTIEGLSPSGSAAALHPVQQAWIDHQVPQCGYCQSGVIMAVAALLERSPAPGDEEIEAEITNICRCGTYGRMRSAIHSLASEGSS